MTVTVKIPISDPQEHHQVDIFYYFNAQLAEGRKKGKQNTEETETRRDAPSSNGKVKESGYLPYNSPHGLRIGTILDLCVRVKARMANNFDFVCLCVRRLDLRVDVRFLRIAPFRRNGSFHSYVPYAPVSYLGFSRNSGPREVKVRKTVPVVITVCLHVRPTPPFYIYGRLFISEPVYRHSLAGKFYFFF